jgi:hypothetical protein
VGQRVLQITISLTEGYDESTGEFVVADGFVLALEHSLVSLSKWESKWEKPFLGSDDKTEDQILDYIRMMVIGEIPPEEIFSRLSVDNIKEIDQYINAKMTATWFNERTAPKKSREIVTSELIYYWMISLGIPFECQDWHLNRLLTLIKVCNVKNAPKKKMSQAEVFAQQRELNEMRRRQTGSRG